MMRVFLFLNIATYATWHFDLFWTLILTPLFWSP